MLPHDGPPTNDMRRYVLPEPSSFWSLDFTTMPRISNPALPGLKLPVN